MRRLRLAAVAAAALALVGCGGKSAGGGSLPDGASMAPADAPAFVSVKTDFSSEQWKNVTKLASRFPGTSQLLAQLQQEAGGLDFDSEVKPALGPELDFVWLDFANGGSNVVALTKPDTVAKLKALLSKGASSGDTLVSTQVGDWAAIADAQSKLDRFKQLSSGDKLDGDKEFKDGFGKLDGESFVRGWVRGATVQAALDRALASGGAAPRITHDVGDLRAIAGAARAESNGASLELDGLIDPAADPATFTPSLTSSVPAGALLYVSTTSLDDPVRIIMRMVGESIPSFNTQLGQVEGVLGLTLKDDVYPQLDGESALAVYRGGRIPPILFLQKVADAKKADGLLRRFSAFARLSGEVQVDSIQLGGETVQKLTFGGGVTIYDGVAGGKIFVSNAPDLAEQAVAGPKTSLDDDAAFGSARKAASLPDKVAAFAYGDLQNGLPFIFKLAQQSGGVVPPEAVENTKPLQTAMLYLVPDGDALRLSGFASIK